MIEITKDQCTRMLVWDNDESRAKPELVYAHVADSSYPYKVLIENGDTTIFKNAKPLPKPKKMTNLDAMWFAGSRIVIMNKYSEIIHCSRTLNTWDNLDKYKFNYLIRENGETKLKHDTWLEFNFDNCDMGE